MEDTLLTLLVASTGSDSTTQFLQAFQPSPSAIPISRYEELRSGSILREIWNPVFLRGGCQLQGRAFMSNTFLRFERDNPVRGFRFRNWIQCRSLTILIVYRHTHTGREHVIPSSHL